MQIGELRADHLERLYEIYRQATVAAPHCRFAPSFTQFAAGVTAPALAATQIMVAEEQAQAVGFAAFLDQGIVGDGQHEAAITALFVENERAGQALVEDCLQQARLRNVQRLTAFAVGHHLCPVPGYNAGWDGLSDRLGLIARLLAKKRFAPYYRELHLSCSGEFFPPPIMPAAASFQLVERSKGGGYQTVAALVGDKEAGDCEYSTLATVSDDPAAAHCGYIWGLYVDPAFRRQGIARHLLTTAMHHLYRQGCTACWLTTASDNWEAQPLYLALGFDLVDASASFRRRLETRD
ncbi:MAG: GNAT family N-acetyltransferase [Caldilineaceae bacterium]